MNIQDPLMDNYYALLLAIIYPCCLTPEQAMFAIKHGVSPLCVTKQTLEDALKLSVAAKEPSFMEEKSGRQYEVIRLLADIIRETNEAMKLMRDYELEKYRLAVIDNMKHLRERMEKERLR